MLTKLSAVHGKDGELGQHKREGVTLEVMGCLRHRGFSDDERGKGSPVATSYSFTTSERARLCPDFRERCGEGKKV